LNIEILPFGPSSIEAEHLFEAFDLRVGLGLVLLEASLRPGEWALTA
jgi:hypothetical protein